MVALLDLAIEIARERREGRKIGTLVSGEKGLAVQSSKE